MLFLFYLWDKLKLNVLGSLLKSTQLWSETGRILFDSHTDDLNMDYHWTQCLVNSLPWSFFAWPSIQERLESKLIKHFNT